MTREALRLQFIVCKVLQREAYLCAARSLNQVDVVLMPQGLHNEPDRLRTEVQSALDRTEDLQGRPYDATLLGYALCSNGTVGLEAQIPTVIPRGHDCITLLLGSKEKYREYFETHRGVYWYSAGWIENSMQPGRERYEHRIKEYTDKYGPDNAGYLMQQMENWMREYEWATYIDWDFPGSKEYRRFTRECAEFLHWKYDEIKGSPSLIQDMADGHWDTERFLVLNPGQKIAADINSPGIIRVE